MSEGFASGERCRRVAAFVTMAVVAVVCCASSGGAVPSPGVPHFRHVILIVLENRERGEVIGPAAPELTRLARRYADLREYTAVAHPSLPNYLALISGSTQGATSDCTSCTFKGSNLADALEHAGLTWKAYAEGLPKPGFTGSSSGRYAKRHVPFLYFDDVIHSRTRLHDVVPLTDFRIALHRRRLPSFSLVVPDLCHDMHSCPTGTGDRWLTGFVEPLLENRQLRDSVIFVTFDEGSTFRGGGGHVATIALGPLVRPRSSSRLPLNHYSLLTTIEQGLGAKPLLGAAATARPILGIWR